MTKHDPEFEATLQALREYEAKRAERQADYDLANDTLVEIAEATVKKAGSIDVEGITDYIEEAIREHKYADRLSVFDICCVEYNHDGIVEQFDLMEYDPI